MTNIFISHRQEDISEARDLRDRLAQSFGVRSVFLPDLEVVGLGDAFTLAEQEISESEFIIVLIGPTWLTGVNSAGLRRLDRPIDYVRREIALALHKKKVVVPVLIGDASMPDASDLPESLRELSFREAMVLRTEHFEEDTRALIRALTSERAFDKEAFPAPLPSSLGVAVKWRLAFTLLIGSAIIPLLIAKLGLLGWKIKKATLDTDDFARQIPSDPAHVHRLLYLFLGAVLIVGAGAGARALYRRRQRLIATTFTWWVKSIYPNLGPGLGFVDGPIDESMLENALPSKYPPAWETMEGEETLSATDASGSTSDHFQRARAWASLLNIAVQRDLRFWDRRGEVMTTFGFISIGGAGLQLAVIRYLSPLRAFAAVANWRVPRHIEIEGWRFPIIVRPWLPVRHGPQSYGNCWVKCGPQGRPGLLTARHAVSPKSLRKSVSINVNRSPRKGQLLHASVQMDAAVIALPEKDWGGGKRSVRPSPVIGYKPVRLLSSTGPKNGQVMELSRPTIWLAKPGQEPLSGNMLFFNPSLQPGDSGCLVLDCELENQPPYLMYLGKATLDNNNSYGFGVLLEQARRIWELDFFM